MTRHFEHGAVGEAVLRGDGQSLQVEHLAQGAPVAANRSSRMSGMVTSDGPVSNTNPSDG